MFLINVTYKKPIEEIERFLSAHGEHLDRHYATGLLVCSGRKVPRTGGMILARGEDRAAIDAFIHADPFFTEGLANYDVTEFTPTKQDPRFEVFLE